jgi:Leucine-rich repeat (LRR) protein
MKQIIIECGNLTKTRINDLILEKVGEYFDIDLTIRHYPYGDLESIIFPETINKIYFPAGNQITSFAGLTLPSSLKEFSCSSNQITSFAGLMLPSSLTYFNCYNNQIKSFKGLILPDSLKKFWCSHNQITNFTGLTLPNTLEYFYIHGNPIKSISNFVFPPLSEIINTKW